MCSCYILHSDKLDKFYVGATHLTVSERTVKHNKHAYGNHRFTALANDFVKYKGRNMILSSFNLPVFRNEKQLNKRGDNSFRMRKGF